MPRDGRIIQRGSQPAHGVQTDRTVQCSAGEHGELTCERGARRLGWCRLGPPPFPTATAACCEAHLRAHSLQTSKVRGAQVVSGNGSKSSCRKRAVYAGCLLLAAGLGRSIVRRRRRRTLPLRLGRHPPAARHAGAQHAQPAAAGCTWILMQKEVDNAGQARKQDRNHEAGAKAVHHRGPNIAVQRACGRGRRAGGWGVRVCEATGRRGGRAGAACGGSQRVSSQQRVGSAVQAWMDRTIEKSHLRPACPSGAPPH